MVNIIRSIISIAFYATVLFTLYNSFIPFRLNIQPKLLKSLLSGSSEGYILPGSQMEPFKKFLEPGVPVSMIMDHRYGDEPQEEKLFLDARSYLAPALISTDPDEPTAIVYCSTDILAQRRLQEEGYTMVNRLGPGKGLAIKKA